MTNQEKYCAALGKGPEKGVAYKAWVAKEFYLCSITGQPCIARELEDRTQAGDVFAYAYPNIDEELLASCPAHNASKNLIALLKKNYIKNATSKLEKGLEKIREGLQ